MQPLPRSGRASGRGPGGNRRHEQRQVVPATLDRFTGQIVRPDDPEYDQARIVWNAMADKRPALIARCAGVDDVITAVRFAREQDLVVAVRGGGHSVAGFSTCDGGIVIDLSLMRDVTIDAAKRRPRPHASKAVRTSRSSTDSLRRPAWRARSVWSDTRAWPDSPSAAAWAGCSEGLALRSTTFCR